MEISRFEMERRKVLDMLDFELNIQHPGHETSKKGKFTLDIYIDDIKKAGLTYTMTKTMLIALDGRKEIKLKYAIDEDAYPGGAYNDDGHDIPAFKVLIDASLGSTKQTQTATQKLPVIGKIVFDVTKGELRYGNEICQIPLGTKMHTVCEFVFGREPLLPLPWDDIYEKIDSEEQPRGAKSTVRDAVKSINKKVRDQLKINQDVLEWKRGQVTRLR